MQERVFAKEAERAVCVHVLFLFRCGDLSLDLSGASHCVPEGVLAISHRCGCALGPFGLKLLALFDAHVLSLPKLSLNHEYRAASEARVQSTIQGAVSRIAVAIGAEDFVRLDVD
jgi:hypothetical protein